MWHYLFKTFERSLTLNQKQFGGTYKYCNIFMNTQSQKRRLAWSAVLRNLITVPDDQLGMDNANPEYIVKYRKGLEKKGSHRKLIEDLRRKFYFNDEEVKLIITNEVVAKLYRDTNTSDTIELLFLEGITKDSVVEYPWIITLDKQKLADKIKVLKSLNGFQNTNDLVPFLCLQLPTLRRLVKSLNGEANYFNHSNRIYYIAEKLKVLPKVVTKYLAKRLFVLQMPYEMFESNLQHMINYNVESMSILKDLWCFRYAPRSVEQRLSRAVEAKKEKIMPWMIRCTEPILKKSLQLSLDELKVLGNKTTVAEYLGERLGFTAAEAQSIMNKHPLVNSVRVTKIKEVLDYILDEAKFSPLDVALVPRILCHSLETTKERIAELQKYGCRPSTLVIVCRSKREYEKFLRKWQQSNLNKTVDQPEGEQ